MDCFVAAAGAAHLEHVAGVGLLVRGVLQILDLPVSAAQNAKYVCTQACQGQLFTEHVTAAYLTRASTACISGHMLAPFECLACT